MISKPRTIVSIVTALFALVLSFAAPVSASPDSFTMQENDPYVWVDTWANYSASQAHGGGMRITDVAGATASFRFDGTSISWLTYKSDFGGKAQVSIDGVDHGIVDLYSATDQFQALITYSGLSNDVHVIQIEVLGEKNPLSDNPTVFVDGFVYGVRTYDDTAASIQYNSWKGKYNSNANGSYYRVSSAQSAFIRAYTVGSSVTLITAKGPKYGQARVWIDDVSYGVIDLYAPTQKWKVKQVFSGLRATGHFVKIEVLHTKNSASTGYQVVVDAFKWSFQAK